MRTRMPRRISDISPPMGCSRSMRLYGCVCAALFGGSLLVSCRVVVRGVCISGSILVLLKYGAIPGGQSIGGGPINRGPTAIPRILLKPIIGGGRDKSAPTTFSSTPYLLKLCGHII